MKPYNKTWSSICREKYSRGGRGHTPSDCHPTWWNRSSLWFIKSKSTYCMYTRNVVMPGGSWWNFDFVELIHNSTPPPHKQSQKSRKYSLKCCRYGQTIQCLYMLNVINNVEEYVLYVYKKRCDARRVMMEFRFCWTDTQLHTSTTQTEPEVTKMYARMLSIWKHYTLPLPVEYENESEMPGTKYSVALLPYMKS